MVLALPSISQSRSATDIPLTECKTCMRVKLNMEASVPISGVKPGLGPMTQDSSFCETAGPENIVSAEAPVASTAPNLRKLRRLGRHSGGNIECSLCGRGSPTNDCTDNTSS